MVLRVEHQGSGSCRFEPGGARDNPMARLARDPIVRAVLLQQTLAAGEFAPDFASGAVELERLLEIGPVLLYFDHGAWCPTCAAELAALFEAWRALQPAAASLVVMTMATGPYTAITPPGSFQLCDIGGQVASLYGLLIHVPASIAAQMAPICQLPELSSRGDFGYPVPATIVINRNGIAEFCLVDPDHSMDRPAVTALARLRSLLQDQPPGSG